MPQNPEQEIQAFIRKSAKKMPVYAFSASVTSSEDISTFTLEDNNNLERCLVVVHKGLISEVPDNVWPLLAGRSDIVFANDVYIAFEMSPIMKKNNSIKSFYLYTKQQLANAAKGFIEHNASSSSQSHSNRFCCYMGNNTILTETFFKRKIYLNAQDTSLTPHICYEGRWEPWVTEFFQKTLKQGDTFVDIGANCGFFSLLAAHHVGPTGRVIAIEPQNTLASLIKKSFSVNGFDSYAHVINCAVGAKHDVLRLEHYEDLTGSSSLVNSGNKDTKGDDVEVKPLPDILNSISHAQTTIKPTVMKIDVEGFEYFVWKGMKDIVRSDSPLTICLEFTPQRYLQLDQDPSAFLKEIQDDGFTITQLHHDASETPFSEKDIQSLFDKGSYADLVLRK